MQRKPKIDGKFTQQYTTKSTTMYMQIQNQKVKC